MYFHWLDPFSVRSLKIISLLLFLSVWIGFVWLALRRSAQPLHNVMAQMPLSDSEDK